MLTCHSVVSKGIVTLASKSEIFHSPRESCPDEASSVDNVWKFLIYWEMSADKISNAPYFFVSCWNTAPHYNKLFSRVCSFTRANLLRFPVFLLNIVIQQTVHEKRKSVPFLLFVLLTSSINLFFFFRLATQVCISYSWSRRVISDPSEKPEPRHLQEE